MTIEPHPERRPAIVTGASAGIGEAIARTLGGARYPVALGARRVERCEEIASEIMAAGGEAVGLPLDMADAGSIEEFVNAAAKMLGDIEIVVSNAGDSLPGDALDVDPETFAYQVEVNFVAVHRLLSHVTPPMIERGRGDLVIVTSDSVRSPWPGLASYVSAKWGLEGLARVMQMELEGTGVRVSIVRPGPTLTEMGTRWDPAVAAEKYAAFQRWGVLRHLDLLHPDHVARAVHDVIAMPRGANVTLVEVMPEKHPPTEGGTGQ